MGKSRKQLYQKLKNGSHLTEKLVYRHVRGILCIFKALSTTSYRTQVSEKTRHRSQLSPGLSKYKNLVFSAFNGKDDFSSRTCIENEAELSIAKAKKISLLLIAKDLAKC
ncbi:hypothetical protein OIU84_007471 [Salix udensis]|uniref:Uncharacterized protein n=1 Tax=Salix udensis TaxID=889485 RepID=A0AAD6JT44_9ROSI|nr:hypothetical protein OIU84_007471 [Salix udensis]